VLGTCTFDTILANVAEVLALYLFSAFLVHIFFVGRYPRGRELYLASVTGVVHILVWIALHC